MNDINFKHDILTELHFSYLQEEDVILNYKNKNNVSKRNCVAYEGRAN